MEAATRLRSTFMRVIASPGYQRYRQQRAHFLRRLRGRPPTVHYFHELADPYSHLAVQRLDDLRRRYDLPFEVHLTSPAADAYRGDAVRYAGWSLVDAASVAPGYGVDFPEPAKAPDPASVHAAALELESRVSGDDFAGYAIAVGQALWSGRYDRSADAASVFEPGNRLRARLGHYAGAMFHFDGEWYWGLDRLDHLERRLVAEGFGAGEPLVPRPRFPAANGCGTGLALEIFPSLRSPYTAIGFDRALALADRTGVEVRVRPVMPMMMRGVPAPRRKGSYIMFDAAREGRSHGVRFGPLVDPFGAPVRLAYSVYPLAAAAGLERAFISRYLRAAWIDGIDITISEGLRRVVEDIGLSWRDAEPLLGGGAAQALLEDNVRDMLDAGLWGVPSFRFSGGGAPAFSCWGQDRLWRLEQEIARRATGRDTGERA